MKILIVILAIVALAGLSSAGATFASDESQPSYGEVIDLPGAFMAADPAVIEFEGVYYMYPTTTMVSVECWSSEDLEQWIYEGVVWGPAEPGSWNRANVWAPDVFYYEDKFYMYYTAMDRIGVAVAESPTGPFEDVYDHPFIGLGRGGSLSLAIDAHVFQDSDGSLYIYTTCYIPVSAIRVSKMSDPLTLTGQWRILFAPGIVNWESIICEGPWMVVHQDVYYLMYSANIAKSSLYGLGYATSYSPMGPFAKYESNPILDVDWANEFYGPGHNSVVRGPDGNFWTFYHTKNEPATGWDRQVRKNRIDFDSEGQLYIVLDDDDDDNDNDDDHDHDDDNDDNDDDSQNDDCDEDDNGCGC